MLEQHEWSHMEAIVAVVLDEILSNLALTALPKATAMPVKAIKQSFRAAIIAREKAPAKACARLLSQKFRLSGHF